MRSEPSKWFAGLAITLALLIPCNLYLMANGYQTLRIPVLVGMLIYATGFGIVFTTAILIILYVFQVRRK